LKKLMSLHVVALSLSMNVQGIAGPDTETTLLPVPALPEDIVVLNGSPWLLISAMAPQGVGQSGLYALHAESGAVIGLLPAAIDHDPNTYPECSAEPVSMFPHGINLRTSDGGLELLVVNHGDREAIEVFGIDYTEQPSLTWRGCVHLPDSVFANGVTPMPDRKIAVTNFFDPSRQTAEQEMLNGDISGDVLLWEANTGWQSLDGTALAAPNGIVASDDGNVLYVASWTSSRVYRFTHNQDAGNWLATSVELPFLPDNLRWDTDGFVLVTGQASTPNDVASCAHKAEGCSRGVTVARLHPDSLAVETRFDGSDLELGDATVAVDRQGILFIGNLQRQAVLKVGNP